MIHQLFRRTAVAAVAMVLGLCAAQAVSAQTFQYTFGSNTCGQGGLFGTTQLAGGGYIHVGVWRGATGCVASDAYVVRTNANGTFNWAVTLDLGGDDSATDVTECANGDLVVCGVTRTPALCGGTRDMFFVRLNNATGAIISSQTFGTTADDIAWDVEEATTGDGFNSAAGDILVAGSTTDQSPTGSTFRNGVIMRLQSTLAMRWGRQYGTGPTTKDDYFYSVAEVTVGVPANTAGDVVAVGATNSFGVGGLDILAVRVDGNSGAIGAAPQGATTFGLGKNEAAYRVRELRTAGAGFNPGDFIMCGSTNSRPSPSTSSEALLVQMQPTICNPQRGDCWFGDNAAGIDVANDVQEVRSAAGGLPQGRIVVAGNTPLSPAGTVTGDNMFLKEFQVGAAGLLLANNGTVYGGTARDWAYSVGVCTRAVGAETPGYVVCGFAESPNLLLTGDPRGTYLVKTLVNRSSGCNENALSVTPAAASFQQTCPTIAHLPFGVKCAPTFTVVHNDWNNLLCFAPFTRREQGGGNDGVSGVEAPMLGADARFLQLYPNPVRSGSALTLSGLAPGQGTVSLTVYDMSGRTVYARSVAAARELPVNTDGWAPGSYMVEIVVGATRAVHQIVVTGK